MSRRAKNSGRAALTNRDRRPRSDGLRIIGGKYRGSRLAYSGRFETRPMKDRVREAIFNLVGPSIRNKHAVDLFAGTGALGLEALSRGAARATFIEQHLPTSKVIRENIARLALDECSNVEARSAFLFARRDLATLSPDAAWVVFCSPPYDFYVEQLDAMLDLVERFLAEMPADSILVVEADARFDFSHLPHPERWDVRSYPPAVVGLLRRAAGTY